MPDRDPHILTSPLARTVTSEGVTVRVEIYRLEHDRRWVLEVVNEVGTSTVWDDLFDTDHEALSAFERLVEEEGMAAFLDGDDVETLH